MNGGVDVLAMLRDCIVQGAPTGLMTVLAVEAARDPVVGRQLQAVFGTQPRVVTGNMRGNV